MTAKEIAEAIVAEKKECPVCLGEGSYTVHSHISDRHFCNNCKGTGLSHGSWGPNSWEGVLARAYLELLGEAREKDNPEQGKK